MAAKVIAYAQFRTVDMVVDEFDGWAYDYSQGQNTCDPVVEESIRRDAISATAKHYKLPESFVEHCLDAANQFYSYRW